MSGQISQLGQVNTTALVVPGTYVQIVAPSVVAINGVPSNIIGVIGTASWGPVNTPVSVGTSGEYASLFGPVMPRLYDLGTPIAVAIQQGASNFRAVRVTDGTDVAAYVNPSTGSVTNVYNIVGGTGYTSTPTLTVSGGGGGSGAAVGCTIVGGVLTQIFVTAGGTGYLSNPTLTITGGGGSGASASLAIGAIKYTAVNTGSFGNQVVVSHNQATNASGTTLKVTVTCPGLNPEVFDNIVAPSGQAIWATVVAAINNGIGNQPASKIVVASTPASVGGPIYQQSYALTGGTDGAGVTSAALVGTDGTVRTGMYALRGQKVSIGVLADNSTAATWSTQLLFGLQEGIYFIGCGPSGDTISSAVTTLQTSGVQSSTSYGFKLLFGDWVYWYDPTNQITRVVSPQGFAAGLLGNLAPNQSTLNKQLYSVAGTQKSGQLTSSMISTYSSADLQTLFSNGIDVAALPSPGGNYFSFNRGCNVSTNASINGDNYTTMTNYIAKSLYAGMGIFVGEPITPTLTKNITATLSTFLLNMVNQGLLALLANGSNPFSVLCSPPGSGNNPSSRVELGYCQADAQIQYESILLYLLLNLQGGQGVTISTQILPAQAA